MKCVMKRRKWDFYINRKEVYTCDNCGVMFSRYRRKKPLPHHFCSRACDQAYRSLKRYESLHNVKG